MAIRLALLAHHYRSDWEWTEDDLLAAERRLSRWREAVGRAAGPAAEDVLAALRAHLADDLDAPGALAVVDRWTDEVLAGPATSSDEHAQALVAQAVHALLGIHLDPRPRTPPR